jgi:hypothetical protein
LRCNLADPANAQKEIEGTNRMKAALSGMIEPTDDGILQQLSRKTIREGEERLLYAMLESAIEDYQKYISATDKKGKELFQQAEEWFFETESSSEFSFESVCDYLKLNACYVRKGLVSWKKTAVAAAWDNDSRVS